MEQITGERLERALQKAVNWTVEEGCLTRTFRFADFVEAVRFVNTVASIAEEMGHHPDIDIRYNQVRIALTTHDAGGITELDFTQASRLSAL